MTQPVPVSAMLPAHQRLHETAETLRRIYTCFPPPKEVLVHIARSQVHMRQLVESQFPSVKLLQSDTNIGPGGARNRMLQEAQSEIVASFDDDSYPMETDFFQRLLDTFNALPQASILALPIDEPHLPARIQATKPIQVAAFVGCGCAYRRSHFIKSEGYVPIPIAYSMEEADLALRYAAAKRHIYFCPHLRVFHNTSLSHHATPKVAAMQVANTALLAFLRYPPNRWLLGIGQAAHKWLDTLQRKRWKGAALAIPLIFSQCWRYRHYRATVPSDSIDQLRRMSV